MLQGWGCQMSGQRVFYTSGDQSTSLFISELHIIALRLCAKADAPNVTLSQYNVQLPLVSLVY